MAYFGSKKYTSNPNIEHSFDMYSLQKKTYLDYLMRAIINRGLYSFTLFNITDNLSNKHKNPRFIIKSGL